MGIRPPAGIDQEFGQIQIFFLAGGPVEFAQADFDDLVARRILVFAGCEFPADEVGVADCDLKQGSFAGCLEMRHRRLVKVTGIV